MLNCSVFLNDIFKSLILSDQQYKKHTYSFYNTEKRKTENPHIVKAEIRYLFLFFCSTNDSNN